MYPFESWHTGTYWLTSSFVRVLAASQLGELGREATKKIISILSFVCKQVQNVCLSRNKLGERAILSVLYIRAAQCKGNV